MVQRATPRKSEHGHTVAKDAQQFLKQKKRVLLADDNPAILDMERELLQPEFTIVGTVADGKSALREATALDPDVAVLDISMGEVDGITVVRQLQKESSHIRVVFLTVHEIAEIARSALAAGGSAYVFKSRMKTDLIPAIHAACSGRLFVSCRE